MELRDYLRVLRAHWIAMIVCLAFGLAISFAWTLVQPEIYTADASGYVTPAQAPGDDNSTAAYVSDNLAKSKVKSYVDLGTWRAVGEHARDELGLDDSPESLVGRVSVSNPIDTVVIKVDADGPTPEAARDLAGAWIRSMQIEIENIESGGTGENPAVTLVTADSARLPASPSSPNVRLALAIGALAGLVVGVGYTLLRFTLDRRIRSSESVERETGLNVVGTIPEEKSFTADNRLIPFDGANTSSSRNVHLYAASEAVRELRTNIEFMDVDNPPRIITITSPLPGEGKSTTAANLAITLSASGQKVVLIDGDLRRPMVATIFHLVGDAGLTDILAGRAEFDDVAQPVGRQGSLRVVAAGKIPPNPSEVLGSQRMYDLVHRLSDPAIGEEASRVINEALVNAVKHSAAREAAVEMERTGDRLRLRVSSPGILFLRASTTTAHRGSGHAPPARPCVRSETRSCSSASSNSRRSDPTAQPARSSSTRSRSCRGVKGFVT